MKYKILFIDEEQKQHDAFKDYMEKYNDFVDVVCSFPCMSIESTINKINENHPDAIVSDFLLNDIKTCIDYNVPFNGSELMDAFLSERPDFPCFVLTSYDDQAISNSYDVNIVYLKIVLTKKEEGKQSFGERVISQIEHYRKRIFEAQNELTQLIEKRKEGIASVCEEQRLIDLDRFIERSLCNKVDYVVPDDMKRLSVIKNVSDLLNRADEILNKLSKQ